MIPQTSLPHAGPPADAAMQGEPAEDQQPRLGFFQQPWVQNVLPFVTSLSVHAVIIVLGIAAAKVIIDHAVPILQKEQTVVPESQVAENGPPGGISHPGTENSPLKKVFQDETPEGAKSDGWAPKAGPSVDIKAAGEPGDAEASPLAIGANGVMGSKHARNGTGAGGDGSGELAEFGFPSAGGAIGPHGIVFGNGGNARQIIFVCDASGSMLNKMATLKSELQKAIDGLKGFQAFNVIFFQDNRCVAFDNNSMVPANPDNKRKAIVFLDNVTTVGTTDPNPGLALAFAQHPQLVYLLTDGDFPDNKAVKAKIAELNHEHKTRINTIAFVNNADTDVEFLTTLEEVARESGGKFKHVAEDEVLQQQ